MKSTLFAGSERIACPRHGLVMVVILLSLSCAGVGEQAEQDGRSTTALDVVILGGRVIDPASGLDAVRNIGVRDGRIASVSVDPLVGGTVIEATGLVVAPGFIDADSHPENGLVQVMDGVTTVFNIRSGTDDVKRWYADREGKMLVNFGVGVGYLAVRRSVMGDAGDLTKQRQEPSDEEFAQILSEIQRGFEEGGIALGMGRSGAFDPAGWELIGAFETAAQAEAHVVATLRDDFWPESNITANLLTVLAAAEMAGVSIHIPHLVSSSGPRTRRMLQMMERARSSGLEVSAEDYPYRAAEIDVSAGSLRELTDEELGQVQPMDSDSRLTREAAAEYEERDFEAYYHNDDIEPFLVEALANPFVSFASHGSNPKWTEEGRGHPRTFGTYSRILGRYVREQGALSLMEALRKMTVMPAERLAASVPAMHRKGRVQAGADADLVVFDADAIIDRATYRTALVSEGVRYVLVNGVIVVEQGTFQAGELPGMALRR